MKNTDTNSKDEIEFNQINSARSPGEQPVSGDKEMISKKEVKMRLVVTVVIILAVIIGILLAVL